jgi:prepilin-type processing-associated H-X9-DG protein
LPSPTGSGSCGPQSELYLTKQYTTDQAWLYPTDPNAPNHPTGVITQHRATRLAEIKDGASSTFLCGEKNGNPDHYFDGSRADSGDDACWSVGYDYDTIRWTLYKLPNADGTPNPSATVQREYEPLQDTPGVSKSAAFGSAHSGGFNMAFCDGSIQSISYDVDGQVFENLGSREDGNVINGNQY